MVETDRLKDCFVYALLDPFKKIEDDVLDYQPIYIGKSNNMKRPKSHIKEAKGLIKNTNKNLDKIEMIESILRKGSEPLIKIIESGLDHELAYKKETLYIKKYGRIGLDKNGILSNKTLDSRNLKMLGGGKKGMKQSKIRTEEHTRKLIESKRNKNSYTFFWSEEQIKNRTGEGNPMFVKKHTDEEKKRRSETLSWTISSPDGKKYKVTGLENGVETIICLMV